MLRIFYIILLALVARANIAQTAWQPVSDSLVSFEMPFTPGSKDTLNTSFYYASVDSLLGLQVHVFKRTDVSDSTGIFQAALDQSGGDTLQAIVTMMMAAGSYELLSLQPVDYLGIRGIEVGLSAASPDTPEKNTVVFVKLFYYNKNFVSFTVTSYASDIDRLMATKDQFFQSVVLK